MVDAAAPAGAFRKALAMQANKTNRRRKVFIVYLRCAAHVVSCAAAWDWRSCGAGRCQQLRAREFIGQVEALARLFDLQMAERHGQGVRGIGRLRRFRHLEECAHHQLHLLFVRLAITGYSCFYFAWRIAVDGDAALGRG